MVGTWVVIILCVSSGWVKWEYMLSPLGLGCSIRVCVRLCTTHCPFCRRIPKNAFIKSTPIFFQRPRVTRPPADARAVTIIAEQMTHSARLYPTLPTPGLPHLAPE